MSLGRALAQDTSVSADVPVPVAVQPGVLVDQIYKARTVEAVGLEGAGGGAAVCPHLLERPPAGIPADGAGFSYPKIVDLAYKEQCYAHGLLAFGG